MQSLKPHSLPFTDDLPGSLVAPEIASGELAPSGFEWPADYADFAARLGFVLSMLFLAGAAIFGLTLSARETSLYATVTNLADQAFYKAGFRIGDAALLGVKNTPSRAVFEALNLPYSGSILSYDTSRARDRLLNLGWVESAEVRRVFPGRLEAAIEERKPFALFEDRGKRFVIDRDGHILGEAGEGAFASLLLTSGDGAPLQAPSLSDALAGHDRLRAKIERAELVAERFWQIKLTSGLAVKLPRKVDGATLDRLETLLASNKLADLDLAALDLRLPYRTVLQLREATIANRDKAIATLIGVPQGAASFQAPSAPVARKGKSL